MNDSDGVTGQELVARELRRHRELAGLSITQLAKRVGYSRTYISTCEKPGAGLVSANVVERIDEELQAGGALIALQARADADRQARRRAGAVAVRQPDPAAGTVPPGVQSTDVPTERPLSSEVEMLAVSARDSAEFVAWAEVDNVGEMTIDQIQADVRDLSRAYLKVDTEPLVARAVALRNRLFELLQGRQKPARTRDLFSAAGWTLTLLAWVSIDLSRPATAATHLRAANVCADNADHDLLRAWIGATWHTAAFWRDDYRAAAEHALSGLRFAPAGSGAALFLSSALALDLAKHDDRPRAREALAVARQRADELGPIDADGVEGPFACAVSRAGGLWADTHRALHEPRPALHLTSQAIAAFETAPPHQRNSGSERMVRCEQVKAHLALGEFDGASEAFGRVLETGPEHRVGPLVRRVSEIAALAGAAEAESSQLRTVIDAATEFATTDSGDPPVPALRSLR